MIIQNNAIFIADAHYNIQRTQLFTLLMQIKNGEIETSQLFLMGDIFDFLSGEIEYFKFINYKVISLINDLSISHEVIYLEGNHDFNLHKIFPNINVISRDNQPFYVEHDELDIALAHGDIFTPPSYELFTKVLRNHKFLKFIDSIDFGNTLSKFTEKKLMKKKICHKLNNFLGFIHNRIQKYNENSHTDLIIEGHFHQGYISNSYINIPSLACDNRYMIYQNNQFSFNTL